MLSTAAHESTRKHSWASSSEGDSLGWHLRDSRGLLAVCAPYKKLQPENSPGTAAPTHFQVKGAPSSQAQNLQAGAYRSRGQALGAGDGQPQLPVRLPVQLVRAKEAGPWGWATAVRDPSTPALGTSTDNSWDGFPSRIFISFFLWKQRLTHIY